MTSKKSQIKWMDKANVINPRPGEKSKKWKASSMGEEFTMPKRISSRKLRLIVIIIIIESNAGKKTL